jgi:hypothetical protein
VNEDSGQATPLLSRAFVDDIMAGSSAARQSKAIVARFVCATEADQCRLLTHIAATESVSLCKRMKN